MGWFGHPAQDREFNVSSEVVDMSSCQASARFNHNTVIYVCVCLKNWHCEPCHFTVDHLKQNNAQDKKFQIEHQRWPERKKKGVEKEQEGIWEEASGERGSFSWTRWIFNKLCFLFGVFYCTLEFPEVVFFSALIRHPKHHISVIFNITPQHVYIFRKLGVLASAQTSKMASFLDPDFTKAFVAG